MSHLGTGVLKGKAKPATCASPVQKCIFKANQPTLLKVLVEPGGTPPLFIVFNLRCAGWNHDCPVWTFSMDQCQKSKQTNTRTNT